MRRVFGAAALAALVLAAPAAAGVAIGPPDTTDYPTIHLTTITSRPSATAPTLKENGRPVSDLVAKSLGGPKAIAIAVDRSKSMTGKPLADAIAAAKVVADRKGEDDQVALFAFSSQAQQVTDFTTDAGSVDSALDGLKADGRSGTALYQTVTQAADAVAKNELVGRVLIVITDGRDVSPKGTLSDAIAAARDVGVVVYPIGISGSQFSPAPLERLADRTGGAYSGASSSGELVGVSNDVIDKLARTWELTYQTAARPGAHVRLVVKQAGAGEATRTLFIPRNAGRPPTTSPLSKFFFHSAGGNLLAAFILGLLILFAVMHLLGARNIRRVQKRVEPHVAPLEQPTGKKESRRGGRFVLLGRLLEGTENALGGFKSWSTLSTALERADVPMRPAELFYIIIGSGSLIACISIVLGLPFIITVVLFLFGAAAPYAVVAQKGSRRQKAFDDQLPDLLMTMGASLRAGHTFRQSLQAVVEESAEPASKEFKRVLVETGIGRPIEQALFDVARRLGSRNFDYLVSAVSIQREVGGSLANLFDIVSETVRQRQQFVKKVRGLTAMGRTSAYVLVAMPFFLAFVLSLINYAYMKPLFTTYTGRFLIIITLVMMSIGSLILKKIVSFRMA